MLGRKESKVKDISSARDRCGRVADLHRLVCEGLSSLSRDMEGLRGEPGGELGKKNSK